MSEQVAGRPAPRSPFARLVGVVSSPKETFEEILGSPGWIAPFLCYAVIFLTAIGIWSMKADYVTIMTDQMENSGFFKLVPEANRDEALNRALESFRTLTPGQITAETLIRTGGFLLPFFHGIALIYATLFVFLGALKDIKLGRAWVNFLLCLLMLVGYFVVYGIANFAFSGSPESRILLSGTATIALTAGWIWMLRRATAADVELNRTVSVCTYSAVVNMIWAIVFGAISIGTAAPIQVYLDKMVKSYAGAYIATGVPAIQALLDSLDLFTIGFFAVLSIGFRALTKLSTGMTVSITFLPWVIVVLVKIAWAAVFG
ncbi:MAG TPA: hypothetical protein VGK94_10520 [Candidatus Polarisedimenticolia bacterium]|jgi:hypothetical protein